MSLDKGILYGKEHRKQYYGAEALNPTARPHGGDTYWEENRLHSTQLRKDRSMYDENCDTETIKKIKNIK